MGWLTDAISFYSFLQRLALVDFSSSEVARATYRDRDQWPRPCCQLCSCFCFWSFLKYKSPHYLCTKKKHRGREEVWEQKINRFPLSGWAVSLVCQWSRYSPSTRVRRAPSQSPLTRGKHADSNQEQVRTQICTSSARPRGWCEGPPNGEGPGLGRGGPWEKGLWPGFHPLVWMSRSPSLTLLSSHQLFTFGYTKGNPGALIVAREIHHLRSHH